MLVQDDKVNEVDMKLCGNHSFVLSEIISAFKSCDITCILATLHLLCLDIVSN